MLKKITSWFSAPTLVGDEEHTLQVNLLNTTMLFIEVYLLLLVLSYMAGAEMAVGVVIFDSLLFLAILILRTMLFKGQLRAAAIGMLVASFITITFVIISMGGITSPATNTYVLVVLLAGVFFKQRGVWFSAFATSLAVFGLKLAENARLLPAAIELQAILQWLTYSVTFLVSGSLIHYAMQTMRKASYALKKEIEERKLAEEKLNESQLRYRSLFNDAAVMVWEEDFSAVQNEFNNLRAAGIQDWRSYFDDHPSEVDRLAGMIKICDINSESYRFFGATEKNQMDHSLSYFFVEESWPVFKEELIALANGETQFESEIATRTLLNERKDLFVRLSVANHCRETLEMVIVSIVDISERKKAESALLKAHSELEERVRERTEELRQSGETYRALFDNSNDGIFLHSPEGSQLKANQRALDMIGYTLEEYQALGTINQDEQVHSIGMGLTSDKLDAILKGENVPLYERTISTRSGTKLDVEINLSPLRNAAGKVIMIQSVVRDVTERKQAEAAIRENRDRLSEANLALEKASRLKDEFLASMSHELRTPLTGILGLSEALQLNTYGSLNEKQLKALRNIEMSGLHLLELINDILDLSKIEADKLDLQFEQCQINDICRSSLQLVRGMANQKHQQIGFSSNATDAIVRADSRRFKQMLVNLLSNAIKFTPEGGTFGLDVNGSRQDQVIWLTVWDKGIGIRPEDTSRLFKPFVQLDASLSRQYSGTGLGLSLVDSLAKLHGGAVSVESTPGQGSRFTISMPWPVNNGEGDKHPVENSGSRLNLVTESSTDTTGHGTILIADDSEEIIETYRDFFQTKGYQTAIARNGEELVQVASLTSPDIIIADIQMPGMDGLQAIGLIRSSDKQRLKEIPIIALTALVMPGDKEKCLKAGANIYISKPVSLLNLLDSIEKLIAPTQI